MTRVANDQCSPGQFISCPAQLWMSVGSVNVTVAAWRVHTTSISSRPRHMWRLICVSHRWTAALNFIMYAVWSHHFPSNCDAMKLFATATNFTARQRYVLLVVCLPLNRISIQHLRDECMKAGVHPSIYISIGRLSVGIQHMYIARYFCHMLSVCPFVTSVICGQIDWVTLKVINYTDN